MVWHLADLAFVIWLKILAEFGFEFAVEDKNG